MTKKRDTIKVQLEKPRRGDARELPSLTRAFSTWIRSSFAEELSQPSVHRLVEKFLHNLRELVRKIEGTDNIYQKARATEMLSRLMETIYSTRGSRTAIEYVERILRDIERIREDRAGIESLGDIVNLLMDLPKRTAGELPPPTRKRAGCVGGGGGNGPKPKPKPKPKRPKPKPSKLSAGGKGIAVGERGIGKGGGGSGGGDGGGRGAIAKGVAPPEHDDVYLATEAPSFVSPGEKFVVRFAAYVASRRNEVCRTLKMEAPRGKVRPDLEVCRWLPGTEVTVRLHSSDVEIKNAEKTFKWNGRRNILRFDVKVLNEVATKTLILGFDVFVQGLEIIELRPEIDVRPQKAKRRKIQPPSFKEWETPRTAFASYATEDKSEVLGRVRSVEIATGIDVFVDCLSIRPGKRWKEELGKEISEREIFWLFWSRSAKESRWVDWEWRKALHEKSLAGIQPHPLEPVDVAPPPEELADLQFGSMYEWYLWDMRTKKRTKIIKKKKTRKKKKIGG